MLSSSSSAFWLPLLLRKSMIRLALVFFSCVPGSSVWTWFREEWGIGEGFKRWADLARCAFEEAPSGFVRTPVGGTQLGEGPCCGAETGRGRGCGGRTPQRWDWGGLPRALGATGARMAAVPREDGWRCQEETEGWFGWVAIRSLSRTSRSVHSSKS